MEISRDNKMEIGRLWDVGYHIAKLKVEWMGLLESSANILGRNYSKNKGTLGTFQRAEEKLTSTNELRGN